MPTPIEQLATTIRAVRPMVPAKDFDLSLRFYTDLGFQSQMLDEESTKRQYKTHVDLHICPFDDEGFAVNGIKLAEIRLSRLTKPQIEKFRDYLLTHNSRALARKIFVSFKSILNEAKRQVLSPATQQMRS